MISSIMTKSTISFLFFTLLSNVLPAQDNGKSFKNHLDVGIGYQKIYLEDENFSPLNQNGGGLLYALSYRRCAKNSYGASVQYSSGSLFSGPSKRFNTSFINANLSLEYLAGLSKADKPFNSYLGVAYNTRVLYLDWYDLDAFSYTATHGFSLKGMVTVKAGEKHFIQSSLAIPMLQFLGRPPYNGIDEFIIENQDNPANIIFHGNLVSINKYAALEWLFSYSYQLSGRIGINVEYSLYAQKVREPNQVRSLSNTVSTGVRFKF